MKCDTKGCRGEMALIHIGKNMCKECWEKMCKQQMTTWEKEHENTSK